MHAQPAQMRRSRGNLLELMVGDEQGEKEKKNLSADDGDVDKGGYVKVKRKYEK